ncbi:MAG: asparaginase [Phycisphaeraceae bacterium]|nr:asparaginase [Phycisphaeraceae bacterium]
MTLVTTGGTIEKTYDESTGELSNRGSIVRQMLRRLRLDDASINVIELMSKDSLLMTDADRARITQIVRAIAAPNSATKDCDAATSAIGGADASPVVVLHGTDTLEVTGEALHAAIPYPSAPIILTGAIRPYAMKRSDALQNLTESIFAAGVLAPGVYAVSHSKALRFPGVVKDRQRMTFVRKEDAEITLRGSSA